MLEKLKIKIARMMQGRYGAMDQLNKLINIIILILLIANLFIKPEYRLYLNQVISILIIYYGYRIFSRNITKRIKENQWYLNKTSGLRRLITRNKRNLKDKNYKYIKCENCKQELRVPKHKGKIKVTCKKCGHKFQIRT